MKNICLPFHYYLPQKSWYTKLNLIKLLWEELQHDLYQWYFPYFLRYSLWTINFCILKHFEHFKIKNYLRCSQFFVLAVLYMVSYALLLLINLLDIYFYIYIFKRWLHAMRRNQRNGRNVFFKPFLLYLLSFLLLINCTTFRSSKKKIFIYPISRNAMPAFFYIFFYFPYIQYGAQCRIYISFMYSISIYV